MHPAIEPPDSILVMLIGIGGSLDASQIGFVAFSLLEEQVGDLSRIRVSLKVLRVLLIERDQEQDDPGRDEGDQ